MKRVILQSKVSLFFMVIALLVNTGCDSLGAQLPAPSEETRQASASTQPTSAYPSLVTMSTPASYPGPDLSSTINAQPITGLIPPSTAPVPESGKASISGLLYQQTTSSVLSKFKIYLSPGQGKAKDEPPPVLAGPLPDKGDIASQTNDHGVFEFNNLEPGNYYLVVSLPGTYDIVIKSADDNTPLLIKVAADQRLQLGIVIVP